MFTFLPCGHWTANPPTCPLCPQMGRLVAGVDYDPAVCNNCGRDEHTPAELATCIDSVLGPPRDPDA